MDLMHLSIAHMSESHIQVCLSHADRAGHGFSTCELQGLFRCLALQDAHSICSSEAVPGPCGVYHLQAAPQVSARQF